MRIIFVYLGTMALLGNGHITTIVLEAIDDGWFMHMHRNMIRRGLYDTGDEIHDNICNNARV